MLEFGSVHGWWFVGWLFDSKEADGWAKMLVGLFAAE